MCGRTGGADRVRAAFLALAALDLLLTAERQVFDFLGYMWTPILANFLNVLLLIFGCFGAVQRVRKYLIAYAVWSLFWLTWNIFLMCFFLNVGTLNRESDILSLGTGSVSWWESNGWGCRPVWGDVDGGNTDGAWLRPARVDGCLLPWPGVELTQAAVSAMMTGCAFVAAVFLAVQATKAPAANEKENASRRPIYTIELSPAETVIGENSSIKPMTPRRVKRRSGSRTNSSVRRSHRRSYRNAAYHASTASLPRDPRAARPASAHSSYSNFHAARPASYHAPERELRTHEQYETQAEPAPAGYDTERPSAAGYDVAGPYDAPKLYGESSGRNYEPATSSYDASGSRMEEHQVPYGAAHYGPPGGYITGEDGGWEAPPPPAPPYCARATPQAPGPPAYQAASEGFH